MTRACQQHLQRLGGQYGDRGSWRRGLYRRWKTSRPSPVLVAMDSAHRVFWYRGRRLCSAEVVLVTFPDSHGAGPLRMVVVPRRKVELYHDVEP